MLFIFLKKNQTIFLQKQNIIFGVFRISKEII